MQILKVFLCQKILKSKIQMSHVQTNYQKYISCSYGYKLVCVDDKFCTPFKTYLHEDEVYNIINMIKKGKYCSEVIKNIITKNF